MYGFFSKEYGASFIKLLCRPLEYILSHETIGRLLQIIHVLGYVVCIAIAALIPKLRWAVVGVLVSVLLLFWVFGGCILTKTEIYYLKRYETVPGLFMKMIGVSAADNNTNNIIQSVLSIIVIAIPIVVITTYELCIKSCENIMTDNINSENRQ